MTIKHLFFPSLSPPGDVLCFVTTGGISSSPTLQIFQDVSHLWWLISLTVCLLRHFPWLWHVQGSFWRWMSNIDTCQSGLSIPLLPFCSKLIEFVRMMTCAVWLSLPEAVQCMCDCFHLQNLITNESKTNLTASILKQAPNKQKVKRNADFNMKTRLLLPFFIFKCSEP